MIWMQECVQLNNFCCVNPFQQVWCAPQHPTNALILTKWPSTWPHGSMRPATLRAESSNNCCVLRAGAPAPPRLPLSSISSCASWPRASLQLNYQLCSSTGRENSGSGSTRAPTHTPTSAHSSLQRTALRCTLTAMRHPRQPRDQHHWMPPGCPPSLQRSWKGC